MRRNTVWVVVSLLNTLISLGCGSMRALEPTETVRPQTPPVRTFTSFTPALRCMDELFATYGYGPTGLGTAWVTSQGVLDKTGKNIGGDNLDVLIATISKLAATSNAYQFVRYNPLKMSEEDRQRLSLFHAGDLGNVRWATYDLSGAITQFDENVDARSLELSLALFGGDLSTAKDARASVLSVDLNLTRAANGVVFNGLHASNTIALRRTGKGLEGGGAIKKVGLFFTITLDQNEGLYAALRTLIELSTLEILGKLAKVPYWQCLQIDATNPEVSTMLRDWFHAMTPTERVHFTQRALAQQGYYQGAISGEVDRATRDAVARYQAATDLVPSGRIDLDLYRHLQTAGKAPRPLPTLPVPAPPPVAPLQLTLTTPRGPTPVYAANERLTFTVQVSQPATVLCFYRDAEQRISRLYPHRFRPEARLAANQTVAIPGEAPFAVRLTTPATTEEVLCVAAPEDIMTNLPPTLQPDLTPLPVARLDEVIPLLRPQPSADLVHARLSVQVAP